MMKIDLIKRQDVLEAMDSIMSVETPADLEKAKDIMRAIPEWDEAPGEWIVYEVANTEDEQPVAWQCSECEEVVSCRYNFCPECGKIMMKKRQK
jgi:hypothetical protein